MTRARLVRVRGQVQGVGYRAWAEQKARGLGLDGWVRNRRDGSVEALLSGAAGAVDEMVRECRHGPAAARVAGVDTEPAAVAVTPGFRVLPTA